MRTRGEPQSCSLSCNAQRREKRDQKNRKKFVGRYRLAARATTPSAPAAQPSPPTGNATELKPSGETADHDLPLSDDASTPVGPTATSRVPRLPGTGATHER